MSEIDWDKLPDAPQESTQVDWDSLPDAPEAEARKPRFDFKGLKEDPLVGGATLALQGLGSVADLVKAGADKVVAGKPLGESLDQYYKNDPTYTPGDAAVEKVIPNSVIGQTVAKTGLDVGADPTTYAAALSKAAPMLSKIVAKAESQSPGVALKTLGKVGEFFTGGRMGPKWAESTAKFTPKERLFSGKTLDDAADAYHPLKKAADDFMSKRLTPLAKETFKPVARTSESAFGAGTPGLVKYGSKSGGLKSSPGFEQLDQAAQSFDDAINKLARMRSGAEPPPELKAIQDGIARIKNRGGTAGPETAELMDFLNNLEYTGMGNPKLVKDILKGPQAQVRAALKTLTQESSPVYSQARQRVSDAIKMAAPPSGGKMGKYMIQNAPAMAATAGAAGEIVGGNWANAAKAVGAIAGLRNPKAYNIAAGLGGMAKEGVQSAAGAVGNAASSQLGKQAIVQSTKVDYQNLGDRLKNNPQAFGKYAPALQQAAQRGPAALSAANYVLSQSNEEYREHLRRINGEEIK
jgi:hypothetical protein